MTETVFDLTESIKLVARYRKAKKIALALIQLGATPQQLKNIAASEEFELYRELSAKLAETHVPSPVTWQLVIEMVKEVTE